MAKGSWLKFDLLRRRREQLGLEAKRFVPERSLLRRGGLIGGGLVFTALLSCFGAWFYARHLEGRQAELASAVAEYENTEALLIQLNQELKSLQNANKTLAEGIAGLKSGSALLTELSRNTPQAVQLTKIRAMPNRLELYGVTNQPRGLYVVNAFQLQLSSSPFFQSNGVRLVKALEMASRLSSSKPGDTPTKPLKELNFDLNVAFADDASAKLTVDQLKDLGSRGLAQRLELLRNEDLLQ